MALEGFVLDGLDLNQNTVPGRRLAEVKFTPAKKRPEWAEAVDGDGALLIRDPYFENSQWDVTVEVWASTRDAAHTAVGLITDKLEEADRNPLGIPLVWTPADSTKALTFYVLTGEASEIPMDGPYWSSAPVIRMSLTLTCRPFGYGAEVTVTSAAGAGPVQLFNIAGVTGDVPAEARLIVTDTATQSRDFAAWGLEYRYQAAADLLLTQPELTNAGFAGSSTTRAGSVSTNIWRGTLTTAALAVCGTGNQPHVGTFRVYARLWVSTADVRVRLAYRDGDGPLKGLNWETPPVNGMWNEVDLGVVTIPPTLLGTQRWQGQVEAYSATAGDTLDVDYLILMPAGEGFGRARRTVGFETSTTFVARDEFNQSAGALTGKTAAVGGIWAGAGDADDFQIDGANLGRAQRVAASDADANTGRYMTLPTVYTNTTVQADTGWTGALTGTAILRLGVLARYVDTNNYLLATVGNDTGPNAEGYTIQVVKRVAGTVTRLALAPWTSGYAIRLQVDTSGRWTVYVFSGSSPSGALLSGQDTVLATGGVLDDGKAGLYDVHTGTATITRFVDNWFVTTPVGNSVCYSGQSIEFRSDETIREDSTGTYWGRPAEYRGSPFFVPPAGDEGRTSRVAVMLRRSDPYAAAVENVTDNQTVEVKYTPRYLYLPR